MYDQFNIPDDCESTQPFCEDCPDGGPCDEIVGAECVFYHWNSAVPTKLINLGLPNNTSSERIFERIDELVGSYFQIPLSVIDTASIDLTASGTAKHTLKADVRISSRANNILQIITGGPEKGLYAGSNADYKVKVNASDVPNYLINQMVGGTDGIVSITVKDINGIATIIPTINICGLVENIINNGDLIDSIIETILNDPEFFSELLEAILNNEEFMNSLTEAIVNNPTFLTSLLEVLENNPQFFEDFFDIIANNPDLLAALCELISNCPGSCSGSDLNVTVNCSETTFNQPFLQGIASSGSVIVPISVTGSGILNVNIGSGTSFAGSGNFILDETDTQVVMIVTFTGSEVAGTYPVTLHFTGANDEIVDCIVNAEVLEDSCHRYIVTPDEGETAGIDYTDCSGDVQHTDTENVSEFCAMGLPIVGNGTVEDIGPCDGNVQVFNNNGDAVNTIDAITLNSIPTVGSFPVENGESTTLLNNQNGSLIVVVSIHAETTGKKIIVIDGFGFVNCQTVTVGDNDYTFPGINKTSEQVIQVTFVTGVC